MLCLVAFVAQDNSSLVTELQQALWQQIDHYLDARTDATFSHGTCPACADTARRDIATHDLAARG